MKLKNIFYSSNKEVDASIDVLLQTEEGFIQILYGEIILSKLEWNVKNYNTFDYEEYWYDKDVSQIFQINSLNRAWTTVIELKNNILIAIINTGPPSIESIEIYTSKEKFFKNSFVNSKLFYVWPMTATDPSSSRS